MVTGCFFTRTKRSEVNASVISIIKNSRCDLLFMDSTPQNKVWRSSSSCLSSWMVSPEGTFLSFLNPTKMRPTCWIVHLTHSYKSDSAVLALIHPLIASHTSFSLPASVALIQESVSSDWASSTWTALEVGHVNRTPLYISSAERSKIICPYMCVVCFKPVLWWVCHSLFRGLAEHWI